jgi:hypothetical protein
MAVTHSPADGLPVDQTNFRARSFIELLRHLASSLAKVIDEADGARCALRRQRYAALFSHN